MATAAEDPNATAADAAHASGHTDVGYYALYFLFLSLVLGALARGATRHSRLPYTVALLFVGLALGFLHSYVDLGALGDSLDIWVDIGPHTMLAVFLPALVFESAFSLEWHTFRRCATQVLWLAGPGVLMGTALVGALLKATLPYDWGWGSSLMLGSILSATDPVAVVALLKEVGASKRLGHIIEGESLVNDGTAIVVFSLLNEIAKGAHKTAGEVATFFLWVPFGSVLVGVGVAIGCHAWLGLGAVAGDHIVQISVTLFACYLCFLVAEFQSEASGVLACVVLGVSIGAFGRGFFTGETEHSLHHFWEMLTFVANTVLFILTGVIIAKTTNESTLAGTLRASDLGWSLIVYFEVLFARAAVIGILYPILARRGYGLTLGGRRGVLVGGIERCGRVSVGARGQRGRCRVRGRESGAHGAAVHGRGGGAHAGGERHHHRLSAAEARSDAAGGERAGGGAQGAEAHPASVHGRVPRAPHHARRRHGHRGLQSRLGARSLSGRKRRRGGERGRGGGGAARRRASRRSHVRRVSAVRARLPRLREGGVHSSPPGRLRGGNGESGRGVGVSRHVQRRVGVESARSAEVVRDGRVRRRGRLDPVAPPAARIGRRPGGRQGRRDDPRVLHRQSRGVRGSRGGCREGEEGKRRSISDAATREEPGARRGRFPWWPKTRWARSTRRLPIWPPR
jgi:NhaP-type Na+/H+ or K+/H+ antiporter